MSSDVMGESSPVSAKRQYTRRTPLCRLCLQEYPRDQLEEIFRRGAEWKNKIYAAVSIKTTRNDRSIWLCRSCRTMIDMVNDFQQMCQQANILLNDGHTMSTSCWKEASDLIVPVCELLGQHRELVSHLTSESAKEVDKQILEISVWQESCEYLDEIKDEIEEPRIGNSDDKKQQLQELIEVEIKEEEELLEDNYVDSVEYERLSEDPEPELEQESMEEGKVKEKKRPNRRKLQGTKRIMKSEKVICDTCGELVSQISLEGHLNRHLGVKPFVCEIEGCGRQLYSKYSLQQHRHLHKSINRYYDCPDCGKRIKGTNCWLRHKKLHTEEPKFSCDVCGKKFRRRFGLKIHSVVHTGVALYPCEICGKHFTVKHNLGAHYRTHMKNGTYPGVNKDDESCGDSNQHVPPLEIEHVAGREIPMNHFEETLQME
ncbi:zinc finger and BTB domain-containing protein 24-like [Toxorhynchites rutilus septentrionalis]|uniref:zinc finger and BTB domain-containing protein 24-like n=1 Tax=Toxorhynchites rutilus septentrionalis TaxID=329112 RepID=UPI0024786953|nr:zinc finger and BTB domain-containing protein 24-like [Toxorhynchites rutilus septentrionalis]